jgi:hypothetical protein
MGGCGGEEGVGDVRIPKCRKYRARGDDRAARPMRHGSSGGPGAVGDCSGCEDILIARGEVK